MNLRKKTVLLLLMVFGCLTTLLAQNRKITGQVIEDGTGEPIPGAVVQVADGTQNNAVISDFDGYYEISVPEGADVLNFSFLGFTPQDVKINSRSVINVTMKTESFELEDVVVVGYGTQKKETLTGAISAMSNDEIKQSPTANLTGALTGKLPGLNIMQGSSQPGEEAFELRLRGASTMNEGSQSPLILIDGVPRDDLSMIDPSEVASISILKDASATAVFGVRGANGVILVTTKTGESEKPTLNVTAEFGMQSFTSDLDMVDSYLYAEMENQALLNDGVTTPRYSQRQIDLFKSGTNPLYPNINWFDVMFKDRAYMGRYNINLSGKSKRVKYFVNVGMLNQGGMMNSLSKDELGYDPQFKLNRYNYRTNLDIKVNDWITAGVLLSGYLDEVSKPAGALDNQFQFIGNIYNMSPTVPVLPDPSFEQYGVQMGIGAMISNDVRSPYGELNYRGYQKDDKSKLNNTVTLNFDLDQFVKGLSARGMVSYDMTGSSLLKAQNASPGYNLYQMTITEGVDENGNTIDIPIFSMADDIKEYDLSLKRTSGFSYKLNVQGIINYARQIKKHNLGAMFVYQYDNHEASGGSNINLLPYNRIGYAGRATYNFDSKYLAEINIGYNGSEQFAEGRRFGFFPAASLGWYLSNENFLKDNNTISNLKLRASYGKVGNDKIGSTRFLYLDNNIAAGGGMFGSVGNGKYINELLIGNPDLTWEVAYKQNYGIDMQLWGDLNMTLEYFRENRDQILIARSSVPAVMGNPMSIVPKVNRGKMKNHGFELDLSYNYNITKDLQMRLRGSVNYAKNEVVFRDEMPKGEDYVARYRSEGYSLGQNFGYLIDWNSPGNGYFTSQEEIDNYATYVGIKPRVGDYVYKDLNGDGQISDKDETAIGKPSMPRLNYSFNVGLNYKGLDFSVLFYGIGDSHIYYKGYGINESETVYQQHHLTAWTPERAESGAEITYPALSTVASSSVRNNDAFILNRRFLRLKNAEIGYTLPKSITKKIGIGKCRLYANGNNLLTWDAIPFECVDPEQKGTTSVFPLQRVINFGINVTF